MACGKESTAIVTWGSGVTLKLMVMEFISGKMEIGTKAHGASVSNMVREATSLRTAIATLEITSMGVLTEKESTSGKMGQSTPETLRTA